MPNPTQMTVAQFSPERMVPFIGQKVLVTITRPAAGSGTQLMRSVAGVLAGVHRPNYLEQESDSGTWPSLWFEHQTGDVKIPLAYSDARVNVITRRGS
ncbi:hypothetical protein [Microbacterium sp. SA39]|uniref:hypothetical protein n=1 Tax=Microbacterium sp. SA39 TaxID=1263625 RepID=UPI00061F0BBD|nr:hypothetical protein [Microbacterium sp. SA39]KJQ52615.1 hypothetical protein RS85_03508 [Microbacterium sp. SA39]